MLVPQESEYAAVGTVAEVTDGASRFPRRRSHAVSLEGLHRDDRRRPGPMALRPAAPKSRSTRTRARCPVQTRELEREYRAVVEEILDLRDVMIRAREFPARDHAGGASADTCAYAPNISFAQRVELLDDVVEPLEARPQFQRERLAELQVRRRIRDERPAREGCAEAAARSGSATDELDPQGAR